MSMEMERMGLSYVHPVVGNTSNAEGVVDIEIALVEDNITFSQKSVEGIRIVKNYKDSNRKLNVTVLRGSDLDLMLERALLYPKSKGPLTWFDERIEGFKKGGTGVCEGLMRTTDKLSEETNVYVFFITKYTPVEA